MSVKIQELCLQTNLINPIELSGIGEKSSDKDNANKYILT